MLAHPSAYSSQTGRYTQSFTKTPGSLVSPSMQLTLGANERVFVSRQDGTGWAVAVGTISRVEPGAGLRVCLTLDKAVPHDGDVVYRIDRVSGYSGGAMAGNLAEFCVSDSERLADGEILRKCEIEK